MARDRDGDQDEHSLVRRAQGGDASAFGELVRRHEDHVYSLAFRMMGNRHDALDAAQEAFLNGFRRITSFRGTASFGTWMYRVTVNTCLDLIRRRGRAPIPRDEPLEAVGADPAESVAARLDLSRAVAALPDEYREPVLLHDVLGVAYDEIARLTGANLGTVKSRISRGRRRLAALLEQPSGAEASKDRI